MLKAQALNTVLSQVLTNGIESVDILTTNGKLIASCSVNPSFIHSAEHDLQNAIMTNLWLTYSTNDLALHKESDTIDPSLMEALLIDFKEQRLCALGCGSAALLILCAHTSVEAGMLKLKANSLKKHLDDPLRQVLA